MEWGIFFDPLVMPQLLAVGAMWALAAGLLYLDFNHPAHRVFALLLGLRGLSMLAAPLRDLYSLHPVYADPAAAAYWAGVFPYFVIPLPFLAIRFAAIYPRRRTWFARPAGTFALTAAALAAELVYLVDHTTWFDPRTIVAFGRTTTVYPSTGPLAALLGAMWLAFGLLVLIFARDHRRMPPGPRRQALLIVLIGFALSTIYESTGSWLLLLTGGSSVTSALVQWETRLALAPVLIAAGILVAQYRHATDPVLARPVFLGLAALPLAALSAVAVFLLYADPAVTWFALPGAPLDVNPRVSVLVTGFWRLTLPFLVTYALLRFQLFDLDLKLKFAVKQTTLASIFVFTLLVLSEILEGYVTGGLDDAIAIVVAVGLTYLVSPIQRFAERVSDRVMPQTQDTPEFRQGRRIDVYRATLERSIEDGVLTANEMRILAYLRDELGLSGAEVEDLEANVARAAGMERLPDAPTKATANPK